ncbi:MAG: 16S rRNA (cytidine(1402)-2'-O)-methyltransferase [Candidatus Eiseniibacteriota bacterium]|nr:MAG: 16S rRNA (cytidine(1402)-2'-O)-methyltransferase [Candidatus Eisenbacteria bacterium]
MAQAKGRLFLVATPIGNMEDITVRALRTLEEVDFIAAEDTRRTRKLLTRYEIHRPLVSYHDHNKLRAGPAIVRRIASGESAALVSDAGSPGISDPGFLLVKLAIEEDIDVIPIPGPSSVICALQTSGLPTHSFAFEGFLSRKKGKRSARLRALALEERTMVFFESPHRVGSTISAMLECLGDRRITICRELTKRFEEIIRTRLSEATGLLADKKMQGEFVLVVEGKSS